jgi:ribonuclease D
VIFNNDISKEELNRLKPGAYNGRIWIVENPADVEGVIEKISRWQTVGFDTETKPSFKKGRVNQVSLVQIATPEEVFLIRTIYTGVVPHLIRFFENPAVVKVGVALRDDIGKLQLLKKFEPEGFLDLQEYSNQFLIESNSLRKLAAIVLGIRISKTQQLSNWEADTLNDGQIVYAATDAWACLEIYNTLRKSVNNYGKDQDHSKAG